MALFGGGEAQVNVLTEGNAYMLCGSPHHTLDLLASESSDLGMVSFCLQLLSPGRFVMAAQINRGALRSSGFLLRLEFYFYLFLFVYVCVCVFS